MQFVSQYNGEGAAVGLTQLHRLGTVTDQLRSLAPFPVQLRRQLAEGWVGAKKSER
jgi:hypothetical protein